MLPRVGRQAHQFDLALKCLLKSLHRFGKVKGVIIHDHILFANGWLTTWLDQLADHRAEQGVVLVITRGPMQVVTHPMDRPCSVPFLILQWSFNFALLSHPAPAAHDERSQRQIDLLMIQIDFPRFGLPLQLLQASRFLLVLWIRTADRKEGYCTLYPSRCKVLRTQLKLTCSPVCSCSASASSSAVQVENG